MNEYLITQKEHKITQVVRVVDVVFIAPLLFYAGYKLGLNSWLGRILIIIGLATAIFNAVNFIDNIQEK